MGSDFSNKSVLVAGGTGGLGRAVSLAFLRSGAQVFVTYHLRAEFDSLKQEAGSLAVRLSGHEVDVTDEAAVGALVTNLGAARIDALVNAVGGYAGGAPLWEADGKALERMLALNLRSGYLLARAVVPVMRKQAHGAIVNIVAKAAIDPPAGAAAYAASKAAALALLESLAADLKGSGVRVNSVLPSIIDTEANRKAMPNADFSKWPKPDDIARVILFLCSDDAKVIHGAAIPVYGDS
jgi:NAD(P)-dependent dehydrogenase (short-subunit alcohol dehydrogenase family)